MPTTIVAVGPETYKTPFSGLITSMKAKTSRITLCLIGDSTGNEDNEWFFKVIKWLLAIFPNYVVEYHIWNSTLDNYFQVTIPTIFIMIDFIIPSFLY